MRRSRSDPNEMSFFGHIGELRTRLIWVIATLLVTVVVGFMFSEQVLEILKAPADELVYTAPAEAFLTQLKLALITGLVFAFPVILYNIIAFLLPALEKHERRYLFIVIPFALVLFVGGVLFAYFVMLPIAYSFFIGFGNEELQPFISVREYVSFALGLIIPFGLVFQLPLITMILSQLDLIGPTFLKRNRKIALLVVFLVGAVLTPPDIISQALMAGPLILLYEISIIISRIVVRKKEKQDQIAEQDERY
ncbi:twin-arginine translocase subunit TatC [Natranaerofaba carboxydovora]|uniref:twin-arginine translocase subunit TatC n=1 Tax=Natranaerofaba carboxydovora TaxID=2742683 RepID=UPI001F13CE36|nr:twin-arginine translocase subunit TatC [Natranaerofaba carboxydovora]UMZ73155.1 Sec-independent protein translocase protein TatC [Natranaerofaba carboxydovora]